MIITKNKSAFKLISHLQYDTMTHQTNSTVINSQFFEQETTIIRVTNTNELGSADFYNLTALIMFKAFFSIEKQNTNCFN